MTRYRIKNWDEYQSYRDGRRILWIKLYTRLLDDPEWHRLNGFDAKSLINLWIVASETDGILPSTYKISFRLRITEKQAIRLLSELSHWVEAYDDGLLQDFTSLSQTPTNFYGEEKRREEKESEKRGEGEKLETVSAEPTAAPPRNLLLEAWENNRASMPAVRSFTNQRLSKCNARLRAKGFSLEDFRAAVVKASTTPFLCGDNDRGWKASFDWFIENDTNYHKVLEGRYDRKESGNGKGRESDTSWLDVTMGHGRPH